MSDHTRETESRDAKLSRNVSPDNVLVGRTVVINRSRAELYSYWRNFENLASFMIDIERIENLDAKRSRWTVAAPAGRPVQWETVITEDVPDRSIAWQSMESHGIRKRGRVEFSDTSNGPGATTAVTLAYHPRGGEVGNSGAKLFAREPKIQSRLDLRRFKVLMETGVDRILRNKIE